MSATPLAEVSGGKAVDSAAAERAEHTHGHGDGGHAGISNEGDGAEHAQPLPGRAGLRGRIVLWSTVGTELLGTALAVPFVVDLTCGCWS